VFLQQISKDNKDKILTTNNPVSNTITSKTMGTSKTITCFLKQNKKKEKSHLKKLLATYDWERSKEITIGNKECRSINFLDCLSSFQLAIVYFFFYKTDLLWQ